MSAFATLASSDSFVALLASAAIKGSLLLMAALLLDVVLRRHTAALRHRIWTAAFAALLLVPLAVPLAPNWSVPLLPARLAPSVETDGSGLDPATRPSQPGGHEVAEPAAATGRSGADAGSDHADAMSMPGNAGTTPVRAGAIPWAALAIGAWSVGAILLLARLAVATACASRLCRRARRVDDPAWNDLLDRARGRLDLQVPVRLVCSDCVQMPMTWGIRRHHVVLPADAERWSNERREVVLLHELAHVRRADCVTHLLSGFVAALYWPHPLVWIARRRQVAECELACDDTVLASGARGADYAWHLLEIARASASRLSLAPAGVMMARKSQLEGRLLAALDGSRDRRRLSRLGAAVPTAAGLLMAVALAGLQPWATPAAGQAVEPTVEGSAARDSVAEPKPAAEVRVAQARATRESATRDAADQSRPARERVIEMFVGLLGDPDVSIRKQAVASLGRIQDAAAVAPLSDVMLNDDDAGMRAQAAWALGMSESPDAVPALGHALSDVDAKVREQAAWALGMIQSPEGVALLVPALDDAESKVRKQAAWALGMVESADATAGLVTTLREDADPSVREQAAWALGMIEDEAGLEALIDAVEDENTAVRKQALWAISMIVG